MKVAILGCGYVGLAIARQLVENDHTVWGVRRSNAQQIRDAGGEPVIGDLTDPSTLENIPTVDAIVFSASSGRGSVAQARAIYVDGLQTAIDQLGARDDPPTQLLYTSSTGVYGDHDGAWVDETTPIDPQSPKSKVLAEAEETALDATHLSPTVVRIAGIYGPDRWGIERYMTRPVTAGYRNQIHRDDVAGAITHLLETDHGQELVVLADDEPVDRWVFADWLADQQGRSRPEKVTVEERLAMNDLSERAAERLQASKRVENARLRELGYAFSYPTYREGYAAVLD